MSHHPNPDHCLFLLNLHGKTGFLCFLIIERKRIQGVVFYNNVKITGKIEMSLSLIKLYQHVSTSSFPPPYECFWLTITKLISDNEGLWLQNHHCLF